MTHPYYDILPEDVATEQIAWERRQRVVDAKERLGCTQAAIAKGLGVSPCRVHQILRRARRDHGVPSPIERFLATADKLPKKRLGPSQAALIEHQSIECLS